MGRDAARRRQAGSQATGPRPLREGGVMGDASMTRAQSPLKRAEMRDAMQVELSKGWCGQRRGSGQAVDAT